MKTEIAGSAVGTRQSVHTASVGEPATFSGKLASARQTKKETTSPLPEPGKGGLSPAWNGFELLPTALRLMTFMKLGEENKMFNQYVTLGGDGPPEYSPVGLQFLKEHGLEVPPQSGRSPSAQEQLSPARLSDIGRRAVFRIVGVEPDDRIDNNELMKVLGFALHRRQETPSSPTRTGASTGQAAHKSSRDSRS